MKIRTFIKTLLLVLVISSPALAWDNNITHPNLTNRAVDYLISTNPSFAYLNNYDHFNINTKPQLSCMDEGAVKEDYAKAQAVYERALAVKADGDLEAAGRVPRYAGRTASAAPAPGSLKVHLLEQDALVREALGE